jgi:hypothetical protein
MTKRIMTFLSIASTVCHMKRLMGRVRQGERRCVKSGLIEIAWSGRVDGRLSVGQ